MSGCPYILYTVYWWCEIRSSLKLGNSAILLKRVTPGPGKSWYLVTSRNFLISIDYNECQQTGMCQNGQCVNMEGSYQCVCRPGFDLSEDKSVCLGKFTNISGEFAMKA